MCWWLEEEERARRILSPPLCSHNATDRRQQQQQCYSNTKWRFKKQDRNRQPGSTPKHNNLKTL